MICLLFAVGHGRPAGAQDAGAPATIEVSQEKGFGRMVIAFKDRNLLPQYVIKSNNGVLVIQFAEAIKVNVDRVPLVLGDYLTVARRDPDGMALRFALARQTRISTMDAGEKLFVDLLPGNWQGPTPTLPEAVVRDLAQRADAALKAQREAENMRFGQKVMPKLDFRVGRQPTFTRFSFGWNVPFDTQMSRDKDKVLLTFNRPARIDFAPVLIDPPQGLTDIAAEIVEGKLKITLSITPEADVRAFREDQTYVVDLSTGSERPNPLPAQALKGLSDMPGDAHDRVESPGTRPTPAPDKPQAADVVTTQVPMPGADKPTVDKPAAALPAAKAPVAKVPAKPATKPIANDVAAEPPKRITPVPEPPAPAETSLPIAASQEPVVPPDAIAAPAPRQDETAPEPANPGEMRPEVRDPNADVPKIIRAEAKRNGNLVRVAFPFRDRVASAAFKRDFSVWLVFDSKLPVDVRAIQTALGDLAANVVAGKVDQAQTVRIDLTQPALTTMGADGNSWILTIGEMVLEPSRPLLLKRIFRADQQGQLQIDLPDAGAVHELADPNVGDKIMVVTAFGPARGLIKEQGFAELDALATAQGVAVIPFADDLRVSLEHDVVSIGRERGLSLSTGPSLDHSEATLPRLGDKPKRVAADAKSFEMGNPAVFNERLLELQASVADAPEKERTAKRLALSSFYIAQRFAPEALGVLRLTAMESPGIERDPGFGVLYAAAQAMTGRYKEAHQVLARPALADSADAALWRTIVDDGLNKCVEGRDAAVQAAPAVGSYPIDVQAMFSLAAAECSVELNDFGPAAARLAEIQPDEIDPALAVKYEILEGRIMDAAGRPDDALTRLDKAVESSDRRGAAEAEYRRLVILHRDAQISDKDLIDRLKSLVFGWRGDEVELKSLRFLANMQAANGQYREAFNLMRSALQIDGNAETTHKLQDEMNKVFLDLFLDGKADTLEPIEALTLYYDFRDMTPVGRQGDEIVRNLADRLISVDLLDQAAEMLTYQVENRLRGVAKAQIAADLAVVHMLNRKPDQALVVLNKTRQSSLPASIERQRRVVEARALSEIGRGELALELLSPLVGSDVDRLKADIAWKAKDWRGAGERLETMLAGRWSDKTALDNQERLDVIRAAIGYALGADQLSLDRLRNKFAAKMRDSPNSRAFDVVTAAIQTQGTEFREIAKQIAGVDTMRSFLDEYRQQYMKASIPKPVIPAKAPPPGPLPPAAAPSSQPPEPANAPKA
ncbi:MAG: tetratricopeptide repeat protein [Ancalomicrobiaceae bacterium]|nr:tetratricopeptide repeat protein [Ancalomicrobiaceae bacterium]